MEAAAIRAAAVPARHADAQMGHAVRVQQRKEAREWCSPQSKHRSIGKSYIRYNTHYAFRGAILRRTLL